MKKFLAVFCSAVLILCSVPIALLTLAESNGGVHPTPQIDGDWYILEDFEDEGKTGADYTVKGSKHASLMDNGEDGNAFVFTLNSTWADPGIKLHDANQLPSDCNWYKYDLKGPAVLDSTVSVDDTFQFGVRFNDADKKGNRRLARSTEVSESDLMGCVYVREKGKTKWTKKEGIYTTLPNDFDGEVMVDLSLLCIYVTGSEYTATPINIHSWFSERTLYSEMSAGEKFAIDNICITNKAIDPSKDGDWYVLEDFDDKNKSASAYAVSGGTNASLIKNGDDGNAFVYNFNSTYAAPGIKLYDANKFSTDCNWYKYDLKGPAVLDSTVSKDDTFQLTVRFNDADKKGSRRLALSNEVSDESLVGFVYVRNNGEDEWTKITGINTVLPNDFDGEVMINLDLVCIYVDSKSYASTPINIHSWFSERFLYANMAKGEKIAIDNICITDKDMTPTQKQEEIKKDGDWYILEDFEAENKTGTDYAVFSGENASLIDNGDNGKAFSYTLTNNWASPGIKLYNAVKYPQDCSWYKYELKGPKALDPNVSDGTFQITVQFNNGVGSTRRMAWENEVTDPELAGYLYLRNKGETEWTKVVGVNIAIPNDFDGEIMFPLGLVRYTDKLEEKTMELNEWFSDRCIFALLESGEKIGVDNICVTNEDIVPVIKKDEIKKDGDWYILEDFEAQNKNGADYTVFDGKNASLIDNGEKGKAFSYTFAKNWANPGIKLYNAVKYPQNCSWYKYELKGPKTLDPNISDGTFQITIQFNNGIGSTRRMAWSNEVEKKEEMGHVYIRDKGETEWTKITGVNVQLPNDFDGEVMFPLSLLCYTDKLETTSMVLNEWFSERCSYALLKNGEKIAVDNICITDKDMTPVLSKASCVLQDFNTDLESAVKSKIGLNISQINELSDGNKVLKVTSVGEALTLSVNLYGITVPNAKYLEFYIEGPGGEGTFQILPALKTETGLNGMSGKPMLFFGESLAGAVYYKAVGEEKFTMTYCGNKFRLPCDFKGVIRYELSRFNSRDDLYSSDVKTGDSFVVDASWFSYVGKGKTIILDNYCAITEPMLEGVDYVEEKKPESNNEKEESTDTKEDSSLQSNDTEKPKGDYDMDSFFGNKNNADKEDITPEKIQSNGIGNVLWISIASVTVIIALAIVAIILFIKQKQMYS